MTDRNNQPDQAQPPDPEQEPGSKTITAWDLQPFAQDCGYAGPPFHPVHEQLKASDRKGDILRQMLDHARKKGLAWAQYGAGERGCGEEICR